MRNRSNVSTNKMSGKESQTEEAPAQKATSMDKNKAKPNKDPGGVAAGKKLTEHNRGMRKEKKYERRFKTIQSVASVVLSVAGLYYKRKELMALVEKKDKFKKLVKIYKTKRSSILPIQLTTKTQ